MRKSLSLAVLAGVLALAACGKKPHEEPVDNGDVIEEPENGVNEVAPPLPAAPPPEANSVAPVDNRAAPPVISEEQQMQDDADATGMTSRLPDTEGGSAAAGGQR